MDNVHPDIRALFAEGHARIDALTERVAQLEATKAPPAVPSAADLDAAATEQQAAAATEGET